MKNSITKVKDNARALESLDGAYSIEESGTPDLHPLILDRIS